MVKKRLLSAKTIYHVYNRAIFQQCLFRKKEDYYRFMNKISVFARKYSIEILTYCLMPNHFHLLLYGHQSASDISKFMKSLQLSHALYFKKKYNSSGHVFESSYKCKPVRDPIYLSKIISYIKNNPVRKNLVNNSNDWQYSK